MFSLFSTCFWSSITFLLTLHPSEKLDYCDMSFPSQTTPHDSPGSLRITFQTSSAFWISQWTHRLTGSLCSSENRWHHKASENTNMQKINNVNSLLLSGLEPEGIADQSVCASSLIVTVFLYLRSNTLIHSGSRQNLQAAIYKIKDAPIKKKIQIQYQNWIVGRY